MRFILYLACPDKLFLLLLKSALNTGLDTGSFGFLLYINDLPKIINNNNNMILFADGTSILVTDINKLNFEINLKQTFKDINTWFTSNLLALNFDKTQYMKFRPMNYYNVTTKVN
jgi:hypothetical protein